MKKKEQKSLKDLFEVGKKISNILKKQKHLLFLFFIRLNLTLSIVIIYMVMLLSIYIDLVFFTNFAFDLILLYSVNFILRRNANTLRIIFGALFGSVTLLILFFDMNYFLLFFFKLIVALIMLLISFGYRDFVYFKKNIIYFYLVSMVMGGCVYFLDSQFSYTNRGLVFKDNGLIISYVIVLIVSLILYFKYICNIKNIGNHYNSYYNCDIYFSSDKYIRICGFLDTGNKLSDPYSNKGIILINKSFVEGDNNNYIYVPYNSLNNHGLLKCFSPYKVVIEGMENKNVLIGISDNNFFIDGIDCILSTKVMEGFR